MLVLSLLVAMDEEVVAVLDVNMLVEVSSEEELEEDAVVDVSELVSLGCAFACTTDAVDEESSV